MLNDIEIAALYHTQMSVYEEMQAEIFKKQ